MKLNHWRTNKWAVEVALTKAKKKSAAEVFYSYEKNVVWKKSTLKNFALKSSKIIFHLKNYCSIANDRNIKSTIRLEVKLHR